MPGTLYSAKTKTSEFYGTCVKDDKSNRVLPYFFGKVHNVAECLAGCRNALPYGFPYAGLEYGTECFCGRKPDEGFARHFTWPDKCDMRCEEASWQNCGGSSAMNLWSVPPAPYTDLAGICVYDHPRDDRVFNKAAESVVQTMTVELCENYCFLQGIGLLS